MVGAQQRIDLRLVLVENLLDLVAQIDVVAAHAHRDAECLFGRRLRVRVLVPAPRYPGRYGPLPPTAPYSWPVA